MKPGVKPREPGAFRLISWNVAGRTGCIAGQVAALAERRPDVVALQEVTRSTLPVLRAALAGAGLPHAVDSLSLAPSDFVPGGPRRFFQLTVARHPLRAIAAGTMPVPWPERVLGVEILVGDQVLEVHNTHVPPGSSNGWVKVETLEGLYAGLARPSNVPRVLCGDLNTPQEELPDGRVVTWGQRRSSSGSWVVPAALRGRPAAAWDAAERSVLLGLASHGMADAFRSLHGYGVAGAYSWYLRRGSVRIGRRFDHVLAARSLTLLECEYLHHVREAGLSDHSAIEAVFAWPPATSASPAP